MHRLELARRALRSLRRIPQDRARSIFAALDELAALPDPSTHPVKAMKGDWKGCLRIRIGAYRAVFQLSDDPHRLEGESPEELPADAVEDVDLGEFHGGLAMERGSGLRLDSRGSGLDLLDAAL